jgi:hypothetical protein
MISWEQHADSEESANYSRAIQDLAEIIDEHYYTLISTPEVALDGFIYDIDLDNPNMGDDSEWTAEDIWKAVGLLIQHYTLHSLWGKEAMNSKNRTNSLRRTQR